MIDGVSRETRSEKELGRRCEKKKKKKGDGVRNKTRSEIRYGVCVWIVPECFGPGGWLGRRYGGYTGTIVVFVWYLFDEVSFLGHPREGKDELEKKNSRRRR